MFTQTNNQKIAKLEELIVEMGRVIRNLDVTTIHDEYWALDGNENGPAYVPALEDINRYPLKDESSPSILESDDLIKIIIVIQGGNVEALHATAELQYVVVDVDEDSLDPIVIGNVNTPDSVDTDLSLRTINLDLEMIEDFQDHPWK